MLFFHRNPAPFARDQAYRAIAPMGLLTHSISTLYKEWIASDMRKQTAQAKEVYKGYTVN